MTVILLVLHDRTGRLEKPANLLSSFQYLHDRTGRLENNRAKS
ncbi:Heat shock protein GrpE [Moraxella catarrhalis]|nr:Heat shock protein GrpE [Moraxella catarrhalis]